MRTSGVGMRVIQGLRPSTVLGGAALVALCLVVYLPGFFAIPPVDRDESRFAQASRQMFESVALAPGDRDSRPFTIEDGQAHAGFHSGGLVIPMLQDRPRLNKPPLIYWVQAASAAVFTRGNPFRDEIWMYRVPSLLAAIAAVLMTWRLGTSMFDARAGWLGAALLAVCPVVVWEAHQARADMVLLAWTVLAAWGLWGVVRWDRRVEGRRDEVGDGLARATWVWALVFWVGVAGGVLTKGPITPLVCGLAAVTYSVLSRRWRWMIRLHAEIGVPLVVAAVAPWVWGVAERVGFEKYRAIVVDEVLGRSVAGKEGHWAPPGYHLVLSAVLLWPGSLMTAAGVGLAWRAVRAARRGIVSPSEPGRPGPGSDGSEPSHIPDAYAFALAWIVPAWIVFELVSTKLPHYTLPLYPVLAVLSARAVFVAQTGLLPSVKATAAKVGYWMWWGIGALAAAATSLQLLAYGIFLFLIAREERPPFIAVISLVLGLAAVGAVPLVSQAGRSLREGSWLRGQLYAVLAAVVLYVCWLPTLAPRIVPGAVTPRLAVPIRQIKNWGTRPIASAYHEDSLVFALRGHVQRIEPEQCVEWIGNNPEGVLIVSTDSKLGADWVNLNWVTIAQASRSPIATRDDYRVVMRCTADGAPGK